MVAAQIKPNSIHSRGKQVGLSTNHHQHHHHQQNQTAPRKEGAIRNMNMNMKRINAMFIVHEGHKDPFIHVYNRHNELSIQSE